MNTTTKPLFEETLDIVFECFDKFQNSRPILPVECLKNYQLIYNEDDDQTILRDDNQVVIERLSLRYSMKDPSTPRPNAHRLLTRISTARLIANQAEQSDNSQSDANRNEETSPINSTAFISNSLQPISNTIETIETIEPLKHADDIELERLMKPKTPKCKTPLSTTTTTTSVQRPVIRIHRATMKRALSTTTPVSFQRRKRIDLKLTTINNRQYVNRTVLTPKSTDMPSKSVPIETENDSVVSTSINVDLERVTSVV